MKRTPDKTGISTIKTFFEWNECIECGLEYRRESVWQIMKGPFWNGKGKIRYCCRTCAPTKQDAIEIFNKHLEPTEANRPKPPPAPPEPRNVKGNR